MSLFVLGLAVTLLGGLAALIPMSRRVGSLVPTLTMAAGCAIALAGTLGSFSAASWPEMILPWNVPAAEAVLGIDPLSALFLVLHFIVSGSAILYAHSYFRAQDQDKGLPLPLMRFLFSVLILSVAVTLSARHALLFLAAWEIMAVSAFFLIIFEHHKVQVRKAGTLYLVASHAGALCLIGLFILLGTRAGSYRFSAMAGHPAILPVGSMAFLLALAGFGVKAGFMPIHVWLPEAHPAAPSPVSAVMSGVVIKTGIYGLVRVISFFSAPPAWWGLVLLGIGIASGILGVLWALAQHDFKRLLAYHSIENIGIIAMGLGLGLLGSSFGNPTVALLGLSGCLLHVVNHGLFKSLLFLGAGSVLQATGTRDMDPLGGLWKKMPSTALFVLLGSAAISGLPPLNGFVSEWLIYMGSFHLGRADMRPYFLLVAPALALIGALALACFTKAFAIQFLGNARSEAASGAQESDPWMLGPMAVLSGICGLIGLFPNFVFPAVAKSAITVLGPGVLINETDIRTSVTLLAKVSWSSLGLLGSILVLTALRRILLSRSPVAESVTWGCGYAEPSPRMQYTSSSYAQFATRIFRRVLRPMVRLKAPDGYFPTGAHFSSHTPDAVLDRFLKVLWRRGQGWISRARGFHQGRIQSYLAYLLIFLLILLIWQFHGIAVIGRYLFLLDFPKAVAP